MKQKQNLKDETNTSLKITEITLYLFSGKRKFTMKWVYTNDSTYSREKRQEVYHIIMTQTFLLILGKGEFIVF